MRKSFIKKYWWILPIVLVVAALAYFMVNQSFISYYNSATYQGRGIDCSLPTTVIDCDICSMNQDFVSGQGYGSCALRGNVYAFNMIPYTNSASPNKDRVAYDLLVDSSLVDKSILYNYCPDNVNSYLLKNHVGACAQVQVNNTQCTSDIQCKDTDPCTQDVCNSGVCAHLMITDSSCTNFPPPSSIPIIFWIVIGAIILLAIITIVYLRRK